MKTMSQDEIIAALIRLKLQTLREIGEIGGNQKYNLDIVELISDRNLQVAKGDVQI